MPAPTYHPTPTVSHTNGTHSSKPVLYPPIVPVEVYSGSFEKQDYPIALRIANGGAGQTGLIKALANAFIDYQVRVKNREPFRVEFMTLYQFVQRGRMNCLQIGWYLGDTTQSLEYVERRQVDIAITYCEAAESQSLKNGWSVERVYGFRDHFILVGPRSNPASLDSDTDNVLDMFNKITKCGRANPPTVPPTRFLSRYDKSATNIKESEIFATIGQVPWAFAYSIWYHQYPQFPAEALRAAASLGEYTLIDKGTYIASDPWVRDAVQVYIVGSDDANDKLLNPARVLRSSYPLDERLAADFVKWMKSDLGGQAVVRSFSVNGVILYSTAPTD